METWRHGDGKIDWSKVRRVLIIRLRSIGDTVLTTPSLIALKRFLPDARIDILLEDWVAPLLDGFESVDSVITIKKGTASRFRTALQMRRNKYDVVFNLHGGTTGSILTFATGAPLRFGFSHYRYPFLHTHLLSSPVDYWHRETLHSAEQHLSLLGFAGVPVDDRPRSRLAVTEAARNSMHEKLSARKQRLLSASSTNESAIALIHPAAALETKRWRIDNFARVAEFLHEKGLQIVAVAARNESDVLRRLRKESRVPIAGFDDLSLPEITALASEARIFVGNDSGIAHIAAAVNTPSVIVFGSSNINHWRPWTDAPNEIVYEKLPCQPCAGYICKEFGEPKCILSVRPQSVFEAIEKILIKKGGN